MNSYAGFKRIRACTKTIRAGAERLAKISIQCRMMPSPKHSTMRQANRTTSKATEVLVIVFALIFASGGSIALFIGSVAPYHTHSENHAD